MKDSKNRFIHFEGTVWSDLSFEPRHGWEVSSPPEKMPEDAGDFHLVAFDADEQEVSRVSMQPQFRCSSPGKSRGRHNPARLLGYLPMHEKAVVMRLSYDDKVIFERIIPTKPPTLEGVEVADVSRKEATITWKARPATEGDELSANIAYVFDDGRFMSIARGVDGDKFVVDVTALPMAKEGRFAVLVTDGVRSSAGISPPVAIDGFDLTLSARVLSPFDGQEVPPGHPVSLLGHVHDRMGERKPPRHYQWLLDGDVVVSGTNLAMLESLPPGNHQLTLRYDHAPETETTIQFLVLAANADQEHYAAVMA